MKRIAAMFLGAALVLSLTACGRMEAPEKASPSSSLAESGTVETKSASVTGVINRIGDYLVLLTEKDEYQIFDFHQGLDITGFQEGDRVEVTYTGVLGDENATPVATQLVKK